MILIFEKMYFVLATQNTYVYIIGKRIEYSRLKTCKIETAMICIYVPQAYLVDHIFSCSILVSLYISKEKLMHTKNKQSQSLIWTMQQYLLPSGFRRLNYIFC